MALKTLHILIFVMLFAWYSNLDAQISHADSIVSVVDSTESLSDSVRTGGVRHEIDIENNAMVLIGTEKELAWFEYQDMRMEAMKITQYGGDSIIAEGLQVVANPDSFPSGFKFIGEPIFTRGNDEPLSGHKMVFNLQTGKGAVENGRTKFEGGFYYGKDVTRYDEETFLIKDGFYTTCKNPDHPHYQFRTPRMKMIAKEKVVAKPVIFYIDEVPLMILPFGMFPVQKGRSSGFIMPSYGEMEGGRFLKGMGYYFAPNDYMDAKFLMDYYDTSGILLRGDLKYKLRYKLNGGISGSITRRDLPEKSLRGWDLRINHSHEIDPTLRIGANGKFQSGKNFYKDISLNREQRQNRNLVSNFRMDKSWEGTPYSIALSVSRTEDLDNGSTRETLPSIDFRRSSPVFPFKRKGSRGRGGILENFNFTYSSQLKNERSNTRIHSDSLFTTDNKAGVGHKLSFSSPFRVLKHISINPNLNLKEDWFDKRLKMELGDNNQIIESKEDGFFTRHTFSTGVSANTKIYGVFNPNIGKLKTVRHVITPSVSFTFTPDFSGAKFGYFDTYQDSLGKEHEYDRFQNSILGSTSSYSSKSLSFSLENLFQAKTMDGETENKFDILSISSSGGYNLNAPENSPKLSEISTRVSLQKFVRMSFNMSHNLYKFKPTGTMGTPEFIYDSSKPWYKRGFARMTRLGTSTRFKLASSKGKDSQEEQPLGAEEQPLEVEQDRFEPSTDYQDLNIPWDLSANLSYNYNAYNPENTNTTFSMTTDFSVQLTQNWKMGHKARIDLAKRELISQDFSFYRDLECWELAFNWTPPGISGAGFFFELRVKDSNLRDLKIRKTDYGSIYGY